MYRSAALWIFLHVDGFHVKQTQQTVSLPDSLEEEFNVDANQLDTPDVVPQKSSSLATSKSEAWNAISEEFKRYGGGFENMRVWDYNAITDNDFWDLIGKEKKGAQMTSKEKGRLQAKRKNNLSYDSCWTEVESAQAAEDAKAKSEAIAAGKEKKPIFYLSKEVKEMYKQQINQESDLKNMWKLFPGPSGPPKSEPSRKDILFWEHEWRKHAGYTWNPDEAKNSTESWDHRKAYFQKTLTRAPSCSLPRKEKH
eukprot:GEMP01052588.1.p1 GENE.GEMP01052588.1~~GEMP01052588.1.p1  ORF type:complete len:253 (+),score=50.85 GEMP01052588.1:484-1242(+)